MKEDGKTHNLGLQLWIAKFTVSGLLLIVSHINLSLAQSNFDYHLPKVAPQSPSVANFMRYGEIPVSHSTGVPDISIPLYTVKSRKLEIPISISYHASGIKVNDRSSLIGLGWVLNAGGLVGLTVMSKYDGNPKPTYKTVVAFEAQRDLIKNNLDPFRSFGGLIDQELNYTDWESDRFYVTLPNGQSTVFRYDYIDENLIMLPYKPWKIDKVTVYDPHLQLNICVGLNIVDEEGTHYSFSTPQVNTSAGFNSWYLSRMISPDKTDTIRFVYKYQANEYRAYSYTSVVDIGMVLNEGGAGLNTTWGNSCQYSISPAPVSITAEPILDSIVSVSTIVKFLSAPDRVDTRASNSPHRITTMVVFDRFSGHQLKSIEFNNQNNFGSATANNQRMKLDGISISGSGQPEQRYHFGYEEGTLPPYNDGTGPPFYEDFWGYYNGVSQNSLVHGAFVPASYSGNGSWGPAAQPQAFMLGDRSANHSYAKACMLNEIQYPTGGKTVFEFEPNYALAYPQSNGTVEAGEVGGFRIYKIHNYVSDGVVSESKRFEYNTGVTRVISKELYGYWRRSVFLNGAATNRFNVTSNPLLPLNAENGPPVFYSTVTEYRVNTLDQNIGKTTYEYKTPPQEYHAPWSPPGVYSPVPNTQTGDFFDDMTYRNVYERDRGNYQPLLLSKTDFKSQGAGYVPVSKTENSYSSFLSNASYYIGMNMNCTTNYNSNSFFDYHWCAVVNNNTFCNYGTLQQPFYFYPIELNATQEFDALTETRNYSFSMDGSQNLVNAMSYSYGNLANYTLGDKVHAQPTSQIVSNSNGDVIETKFKYPFDLSTSSAGGATNVYDMMLNRNILTPVIQQSNWKNNNFVEQKNTNYQQWNANGIWPRSVQSKVGAYAIDTRVNFVSYDSYGNTTEIQKINDVTQVYIWGYKGTLPVAEVTGSDYTTVSGLVNMNVLYNAGSYSDQQVRAELNKIKTGLAALGRNALVTTYTYLPLIGVTSLTDSNGRTTYYEYDGFNRLAFIKDHSGNIIKRYTYNYFKD